MTLAIPNAEPLAIRAGETIAWQRELPEFSTADGWQLAYRLLWRDAGAPSPVDIPAVGAGTFHTVELSATSTATWTAGWASLWGRVERTVGGVLERFGLGVTSVEILPNLLTATTLDARSDTNRALADLREALASYVAGGQGAVVSYTIGDKSMTFRSVSDITALIRYYEAQAIRECLDRNPRVLYRAG